jgi:putative ABC transport system permease protein
MAFENTKYSLRNIQKRKARSFLTVLSIFIGIATIFIFISFGLGLYSYINDLATGSSADKIIIQGKTNSAPGLDASFKLTDQDLRAVKAAGGVYDATGVYFKVAQVTSQDKLIYSFLISMDPQKPMMLEIGGIGVAKGRELEKSDKGKVVLGYSYGVDKKIFPKALGLNDKININGQDLRIVGFLEEVGTPQDDSQIYINNDYLDTLYPGNNSYGYIIAKVDIKNIQSTIVRVESALRNSRDVKIGKEDFFVQSFEDLIKSYSSALNVVIGFIIFIAFISVLVSAINTANTMITSVLDRYKEIGIIKSIGAKNSVIFSIFFFESAFLGFLAGVIGVIIGYGATSLAGTILSNLGWSFLQPLYSFWLFVGCILFATITGAISGVIPAIRASKINPVDALRYE